MRMTRRERVPPLQILRGSRDLCREPPTEAIGISGWRHDAKIVFFGISKSLFRRNRRGIIEIRNRNKCRKNGVHHIRGTYGTYKDAK